MSDTSLSGSCLCGTVRFRVTGAVMRFLHCHCLRCRKATGTGHATNLIVKSSEVEWLSGEESVARYKVPDAERFSTAFCTTCGGQLPRAIGEIVVLPAGSLDQAPDAQPSGRIFWGSRAEWSCDDSGLPTFTEYPT